MIRRLRQLVIHCFRRWRAWRIRQATKAQTRGVTSSLLAQRAYLESFNQPGKGLDNGPGKSLDNGANNQTQQSQLSTDSDQVTYAVPRDEIVKTLNHTLKHGSAQGSSQAKTAQQKKDSRSKETDTWAEQPDMIKSFADSAYVCECQGRFGEAERLYKQALMLSVRRFGEAHLAIVPHLNELATLYCVQKRYRQALPLLISILKIRRHQQAAHHTDIGEACYQLAQTYVYLQQYQQAEPLFQSALDIFRSAYGPKQARTQAVYCELMRMIAIAIEADKFEEITAEPAPLDLENLSDRYPWAKPAWLTNPESGDTYSWIKLHQPSTMRPDSEHTA